MKKIIKQKLKKMKIIFTKLSLKFMFYLVGKKIYEIYLLLQIVRIILQNEYIYF